MSLRNTIRPSLFFFFIDTATTEIYTLSLHDALPIFRGPQAPVLEVRSVTLLRLQAQDAGAMKDRKSTRLNSSHSSISYAVFCLKKKTQMIGIYTQHCHDRTAPQPVDLYIIPASDHPR